MSKKRTLVVIFVCGFIPLLWGGLIDREWPDLSAHRWLVFLGGLVVIAVVSMVADSIVAARKERSGRAPDEAR